MKLSKGIGLLLFSVVITMTGSVLKILKQELVADVLLSVGVISFLVAIGVIIYRIGSY